MIQKKRVVIFASGSGSNAEQLCRKFKFHKSIEVVAVFTNNPQAGVIDRVSKYHIPIYLFSRIEFRDSDVVANELLKLKADFIVLAGFLWLIPQKLIHLFPERIINIHPALLPKYGGKGMYGMNVHHAVIQAKEEKSGITIHLVNDEYDKGRILFQAEIQIAPQDTAGTLAEKIHALEYENFSTVIERYITSYH